MNWQWIGLCAKFLDADDTGMRRLDDSNGAGNRPVSGTPDEDFVRHHAQRIDDLRFANGSDRKNGPHRDARLHETHHTVYPNLRMNGSSVFIRPGQHDVRPHIVRLLADRFRKKHKGIRLLASVPRTHRNLQAPRRIVHHWGRMGAVGPVSGSRVLAFRHGCVLATGCHK